MAEGRQRWGGEAHATWWLWWLLNRTSGPGGPRLGPGWLQASSQDSACHGILLGTPYQLSAFAWTPLVTGCSLSSA